MAALDTFTIKWRLGVLLLFSALLIGACSGSDAPDTASTEEAPIATSVSASGSATSTPTSAPEQTSGGGTIGLNEALNQAIGLYEELLDVLVDVTDVASARAAADDVTRLVRQFEELEKRMEDYSEAEIASAAIGSRFQNFGQELGREMFRISVIPGAGDLLGEAFENLGGGETPPSTLTGPAGRPLETVAPVVGTDTPPSNADLSAGGTTCQLFGGLFAEFAASLDPTKILDFSDSVQVLQASAESADEPEIRDAVRGIIDSVDNELGVPDDTIGIHMEALNQICITNYLEVYMEELLKGLQQ